MITCDQFPTGTRKRAICDGSIDMPLAKINAYRSRWGWPALHSKPATTYVQPRPVSHMTAATIQSLPPVRRPDSSRPLWQVDQPGTRLKAKFARWHAQTCPICEGLAATMDQWGAPGCRARFDELVADIHGRGQAWFSEHFPKLNGLIVFARSESVRDIAIKLEIKRLLWQSIRETETAETEAKKKLRLPRHANRGVGVVAGVKRKAAQRLLEMTAAEITGPSAVTTTASSELRLHRLSVCHSCPHHDGQRCQSSPNRVLCEQVAAVNEAACPAGRWFAQTVDAKPPEWSPVRNLIWHIWPGHGQEWNWHWHAELIRHAAPLFDGKIAIGVNTGRGMATLAQVQSVFERVPVTDWIERPAVRSLGETTTFVDLLQLVQTDSPDAITFRGHCKGVTHRPNSVEQEWARLMWAACMDLGAVHDALRSHIMAGPLKCQEPLVSHQRYRWFYAGTFFWFRNREIFQRDWSAMEQTRWYPEAWPGVLCRNDEAACLIHDFTDGSVLRQNYWRTIVAQSWDDWKAARPNRDRRYEI